MPNRLSQPVKQTSVHCADLGGARVVRNAIDSGPFHIPVNLLDRVPPRHSYTDLIHAHISQVNRLLGFGDNNHSDHVDVTK